MLWCCGCAAEISARLTDGREIYRHRPDLARQPFWRCDACGNHVGCHHKAADRTRPLGNIPTPAIRDARSHIHRILDPLWRGGGMSRRAVYAALSNRLGRPYHTAELRSLEEARDIYRAIRELARQAGATAKGA